MDLAVDAAERALEGDWKKMGASGRANLLYKLAELWKEKAHELAELECLNNGTPIAQQKGGVEALAHEIQYHAGWCTKALDGRLVNVDGPFHVYTSRERMWLQIFFNVVI